jgi:hypothetical protein
MFARSSEVGIWREDRSPGHSTFAMIKNMSSVLTITVPEQLLSRLEDRANAEGVDILTLANRALLREANLPKLDDILKPVRDAFAESGMTDDELSELLEIEKHSMRVVPYGTG